MNIMTGKTQPFKSKRDRLQEWWKARKSQGLRHSASVQLPSGDLNISDRQPPALNQSTSHGHQSPSDNPGSSEAQPPALNQSTSHDHQSPSNNPGSSEAQPPAAIQSNSLGHQSPPGDPFLSEAQSPALSQSTFQDHQFSSVHFDYHDSPVLPTVVARPSIPTVPSPEANTGRSPGQPEGMVVDRSSYIKSLKPLKPTTRPGFANDRVRTQLARDKIAIDRRTIESALKFVIPRRRKTTFSSLSEENVNRIVQFLDFPSVVCLRASSRWLRRVVVIPRTAPTLEDTELLRNIFLFPGIFARQRLIAEPRPIADNKFLDSSVNKIPVSVITEKPTPLIEDIPSVKKVPQTGLESQTKAVEVQVFQSDKSLAAEDISQLPEVPTLDEKDREYKGDSKPKKKKKRRTRTYESLGSMSAFDQPRKCGLCLGILNGVGNPAEWCRCH